MSFVRNLQKKKESKECGEKMSEMDKLIDQTNDIEEKVDNVIFDKNDWQQF